MSTEVTKHNDQTAEHFWRADITGLRALAVIPVILYHAFPMLAPGGYVGVDIFFVISGFFNFRHHLPAAEVPWKRLLRRLLRKTYPKDSAESAHSLSRGCCFRMVCPAAARV